MSADSRCFDAAVGYLLPVLAVCCSFAAGAEPRILPSGPSVPENLLRIEIELDEPIARPIDMHYVELHRGTGKSIPEPFLDFSLLSRDGRTVTLLMHPGRLKTDVGPNRTLGLPLRRGERVTLVVTDPQLAIPLKKRWQVIPAVRTRLSAEAWKLVAPPPESCQALVVFLTRPVGSSARGLIAVADEAGRRVEGRATLPHGETQWRFVPDRRWQSGHYELRVHPSLEDVSGNRTCAPFEERYQQSLDCRAQTRVPFMITASSSSSKSSPLRATCGDSGENRPQSHAQD